MVARHPAPAPIPVSAPTPVTAPKPVESPESPTPQPKARPKPRPAPKTEKVARKPLPTKTAIERDEPPEEDVVTESRTSESATPQHSEASTPAMPAGAPAPSAESMASYAAVVRELILQEKRYPAMAKRRGIEGGVPTRIFISPAGQLESVSLLGRPPRVLAKSTRDAVERAHPFPAPPAGRAVEIEITLHYDLDD